MPVYINICDLKSVAINTELMELARAWDAFGLSSEASALVGGVLFRRIFAQIRPLFPDHL
jgi:hypothetical protein